MTLTWEAVRADAMERARTRRDRHMAMEPAPRRFPASPSHDRDADLGDLGVEDDLAPEWLLAERQEALTYLLHLHQLLLTVQEANGWSPTDVALTLAELDELAFDRITVDARRLMLASPVWRFLLHEAWARKLT